MKTVSVAELKNNLSRYLRDVRRGERFTVLSRDVPVAELSPLQSAPGGLEVSGPKPGTLPPGRQALPPRMPGMGAAADVVEVLLSERGER